MKNPNNSVNANKATNDFFNDLAKIFEPENAIITNFQENYKKHHDLVFREYQPIYKKWLIKMDIFSLYDSYKTAYNKISKVDLTLDQYDRIDVSVWEKLWSDRKNKIEDLQNQYMDILEKYQNPDIVPNEDFDTIRDHFLDLELTEILIYKRFSISEMERIINLKQS